MAFFIWTDTVSLASHADKLAVLFTDSVAGCKKTTSVLYSHLSIAEHCFHE